jgi:hypothetical protein
LAVNADVDHQHPNEKDHDQARQLIAAVDKAIGSGSTKD